MSTPRLFVHLGAAALLVAASLAGAPPVAAQPTFSLDDDPSLPATGPFVPPHRSAEDPYGFFFGGGACPGAPLGPSPSLGFFGLLDSDTLLPGPAIDFPFLPLDFLDAVSSDHSMIAGGNIVFDFSVDRASAGAALTGVAGQSGLNQHPADIFRTNILFPAAAGLVGTVPAGVGWAGFSPWAGACGGNALLFNQGPAGLGLIPAIGPGAMGPAITCGSHDNVDAYEALNSPLAAGATPVYYSFPPAQTAFWGLPPGSEGDIYDLPPATPPPGPVPPFAPAAQLGLGMFGPDDINGLVVYDFGPQLGPAWGGPGAQTNVDYALFTLSPGSASLAAFGLSAGDVFFTDFNGSFLTFATACDLGLLFGDNVDALEALPC